MQSDAHQQLVAAVRTRPTKTRLLDHKDRHFLYIEYSWWFGWIVTRWSLDDMNRAHSDLNLGQPLTTLPTRQYGFGRRMKAVACDSPVPVRLGTNGLERVEQQPVSLWQHLRAAAVEVRLRAYPSPEEVRELAGQILRAEPRHTHGGSNAA